MEYEVKKDIPFGWEVNAKVGDILTLGRWKGIPALFKDGKAVCDADSHYAYVYCDTVEESK